MAKVTAPLLSFGASGTIAKTQVYASWRGIDYARRHVIPSNPNTAAQQGVRNTFKWLNNVWRFLPSEALTAWDASISGRALTARNNFLKFNNGPLIGEADLTNFTFSPSVRNGPVAEAIALTAGSQQITVDLTEPSVPAGWTINKAVAAAIRDQDPQDGQLFTVTAGEDATTPYQIILTGLTASQLYLVGGWFEYTRPDGSFAYGVSLQDTATPTV